MKKSFCIAIMLAFLLPCVSHGSELPDFPFVHATGQAETEVPPDIATVSFNVEAFDKDPDRAAATVGERSKDLVSLFEKYNIDKKDIVAYESTKNTVRERKDYVQLNILGYETGRRFSVKIRALDRYGDFIAALLDLKNVTNLQTAFDTSRRRTVEAELVAQACAKAREQADALARGFGTEVTSIFAITTSNLGFIFMSGQFGIGRGMGIAKGESAAPPAIFVPSTIKLQKAVTAIFKLKI